MTPKEYARYRRVSLTKIRDWYSLPANPLPVDRLGKRIIRVRVQEADAWIAAGGPEWALKCRAAAAASREAK